MVPSPPTYKAPPSVAELPMNLDSVTLTAEANKSIAPPCSSALLYLNVELIILVLPIFPTNIAPPFLASLCVKFESLMVPLDATK